MEGKKVTLEDIVSLAKRRGFIYPSSEIYGGLSGVYDYGPLGVKLKHNIQNLWWNSFVSAWDDMYPMDSAILMNKKVWEASGHVDTFHDPLVVCSNCHSRHKKDDVQGSKCPACDKEGTLGEPRQFNMMFKTPMGPTWGSFEADENNLVSGKITVKSKSGEPISELTIKEDRDDRNSVMVYDKNSVSYLRPETAQGMFVNFKNILDTVQPDMPFGLAQIGKGFRNEISPREWLFRLREFEMMEIEYFVHPDKWEEAFEEWRKGMVSFFTKVGFTFDKKFTSKNAACMIIGKNIFAMLLLEKVFKTFTPKKISNAKKQTEVLLSLAVGSRKEAWGNCAAT